MTVYTNVFGGGTIYPAQTGYVSLSLAANTTPARVLAQRYDAGHYGMKTGEGFYRWTPDTIAAERARYDGLLMAGLRLLAPELPKIEDQ